MGICPNCNSTNFHSNVEVNDLDTNEQIITGSICTDCWCFQEDTEDV